MKWQYKQASYSYIEPNQIDCGWGAHRIDFAEFSDHIQFKSIMKSTLKAMHHEIGCYSTLKIHKNSDIFRRKSVVCKQVSL